MMRIARQLTLRQRLLAMVAVAIVPAVAALVYFIAAFHQEREDEVNDQALSTSQIVALEMERIVGGAEAVLETLAFAPPVRTMAASCADYLAEIDAKLPQLSGFVVADTAGNVRCATGALAADGVAGKPWFEAALSDGRLAVGDFTQGRRDDPAYLPVALPVSDDGRETVLVTGIDLAWLGARVRERNLAGSSFAIADRNGILLAREPMPEQFIGTRVAEPYLPLLRAARPGTIELTGQDGDRRIVGYQPPAATGVGLFVSVGVSTDAAFGPIYASTWRSLALAGLGAAAACLVAWTVGERLFRRPIRRILATIASWRAGDETARTGMAADASELSALAASIDEYMDNLVDVRAERAAEEERRTLMLREMNHRIKNVLAAVQAIANQTFKDRATPDSLRTFGNRLAAMAAAHDLLVTENWESADLYETVAAALNPFGFDRRGRFSLEGPQVQITAKAALSLSMSLHELCTNAAKYGALTTPDGQVTVRWRLLPGEAGERFHMSWTERGGPPVSAPSHNGFGTRLIQSAMASELSATADLSFPPTGLEFVLDADAALVVVSRRMEGTAA